MTRHEFSQVVMALRTYYPREKILPNDQAMALWFEQLADLEYSHTVTALKRWVATNKWSPSIAEIREQVSEITKPEIKDWSEAWEDARMAVRNFGSYDPEGAFASLDELTREAVKRVGYYDLCMGENHAADRANFRLIYESLASRKKVDDQIPPKLRRAIEAIKMVAIDMKGGGRD